MLILSDGLRYRHLSETRAAVCLIPGTVFVLIGRRFRPACGVVTSTTLEGDESPEAFHA